jgi:hypothetical protein
MDILWRVTNPAALKRRSIISFGIATPSAMATDWASTIIVLHNARRLGSVVTIEGRKRKGANRVEANIAPKLEPHVPADRVADGRVEAGRDQCVAQRSNAIGTSAVGFAYGEAFV